MRETTLLLVTAAVLLGVLPVAAQDEPAAFGERLDVTEVLLDVLVTDQRGNVILGLDEDDFVIEDGGEPVEIRSSTFYSNRRYLDDANLAGRLGVQASEVPVDRFFILFFHDQRRLSTDLTRNQILAVRRVKDWVYNELLPNDWVAVLSYDAKLQVHQDFTTDNEAIVRALDDVAKGRDPGATWASRIAEHEGPSLAVNLPRGKELARATRRIYSALQQVADAAGYITGRKNLMLFSIGFGRLNDFGTYLPDERYYGDTMQALNDNNVATYAISWIESAADEGPAAAELSNVLSLLASDTGGRYYFNFIDFREPLRQVAEDNNGYYLLSYAARHPAGAAGYNNVKVTTKNPDFVVRARQGYRYGS
ncbi:MAG: VWA domain-containing protein [Thermoanaerobaculia bacterium]|nr:VWA domain-containing protein [Thermoanaerobaculia bacterium]